MKQQYRGENMDNESIVKAEYAAAIDMAAEHRPVCATRLDSDNYSVETLED